VTQVVTQVEVQKKMSHKNFYHISRLKRDGQKITATGIAVMGGLI
jgi:hypothetical protein